MDGNAGCERPSQVTKAVYLLYLDLGIAAVRGILECTLPGGNSSEGFGTLGLLPVAGAVYYMIGRGKNWARITFLVLWAVGLPVLVIQFPGRGSGWLDIGRVSLDIAETGIALAALALLFQRVSSDWFRAVSGPRVHPAKAILQALRNTNQPIPSYVWRAWLISFIPSIVMAPIVVGVIMPEKVPSIDGSLVDIVLAYVLLAPWAETLLMWPILWILKRTIEKTLWIAIASAVIWGLLHSTAAPVWGLTIAWPFFVFSLCFLEWEKKSTRSAITATALVHMCQNAVPALVMVLSALLGT